ncbi:THO complex subunit 4 [Psilocybe cubensis]|uniref:THO complex subunit 4 n=1 Tax=Psilocybe cubensis TaxID=181762 RepID=A0ACB8GRL5_PSICU|nr:THO complex subunit 4 [Psilocybe cubensis]KAH9478311.1 THO complex subunit 4 [Psilocybe cubensis]
MASRSAQRKPYSRPAARADGQWLHDKAPTGPAKGRVAINRVAPPPTGPAAAAAAGINNKLLVSNLHYEITPKDLTSVFGQIGTLIREPLLRYDRSGRSSGTAIISFETALEATRAKKQFDGYLAKGQPMSIAFDTTPPPRAPRASRRAVSAPTTKSLLNRIEKPPLAERLAPADDSAIKTPSAPRAFTGAVRTKAGRGSASRGPASTATGRAPKGPKKPKTAEELDKELDAFMGDADPADTNTAATSTIEPTKDVDMV